MKMSGRTAIVTGGAGGIGAALAARLVTAGARVVIADLDHAHAEAAAESSGALLGVGADVSSAAELADLIARTEKGIGPVDLFFANAGVGVGDGLAEDDAEWALALDVNVLAHVRAARLLVPRWLERGEGYFVSTASAAGLLTQIGSAPYSVTKHAAVAFAEWLSVTYGDRGVRVSCLCPMGVNTAMLGDGHMGAQAVRAAGAVLEPEQVAAHVLAAVEEERFLILPHPEVLEFFRRKASDYDRWLAGMRRLQAKVS
nr:SDR family oxidoreductase [Nonomuraea lactucae]